MEKKRVIEEETAIMERRKIGMKKNKKKENFKIKKLFFFLAADKLISGLSSEKQR